MSDHEDDSVFQRVDRVLQNLQQGDCVIGQEYFVYRIDPQSSITVTISSNSSELVEDEVRGLCILTQTCDIVRTSKERPYLEVCPLVEVESGILNDIRSGKRPSYAYIPKLSVYRLVADLDRVMTIEKPVVLSWKIVQGCQTDNELRIFGQSLSRKRSRFAYPDHFNIALNRLTKRLKEKHNKATEEGEALRSLREIRVRAAPSWQAEKIELMLYFIRNEEESSFQGQSWSILCQKWLDLIPETERFGPIYGQVVTLDDMTARDHVESDQLDLDHLSQTS